MELIFRPRVLKTDNARWEQPGNAGNSGGPDPTKPHGTYVLGEDENSNLSVYVSPVGQYDNFYFLQRFGPELGVVALAQRFSFKFPNASDLANCQAFEWEVQQLVSGTVWNCAWQIDMKNYPAMQLRAFNYSARFTKDAWVPLGSIPISVIPGAEVIVATEHILESGKESHVGLWLNGKHYPTGFSNVAVPGVYPGQTGLNVAFQVDCKANAAPVSVIVGGMQVAVR